MYASADCHVCFEPHGVRKTWVGATLDALNLEMEVEHIAHFFRWVDDPDNDHTCAILFELMIKNKLLEDQLRHKKVVKSKLYFLLIALCGLCLGLTLMIIYIIFGIPQGIERCRLPF
jgi:hypothetical protein